MADAWWRLQRACRVKAAFLSRSCETASDEARADIFLDPKESAKFRLVLRYLSAAERAWNKALADLNGIRRERQRTEKDSAKKQVESS